MKRVACIGAGTVGGAWAVVFARAGFSVTLYDEASDQVTAWTLPQVRRTLTQLHEAGLLTEDVSSLMKNVIPMGTIAEAVRDCVWVQESVREDLEVKRTVFDEISKSASPNAILASSTSAIPGSEFLHRIDHPNRALVAHPVNPPSLIPLVELCGTGLTSTDTLDEARSFLSQAGMKPITLNKEIDGFILNRLQFALVAEALHLVGEGYCSPEDIDATLKDGLALRWASIGPFEVAHLNAPDGIQGFVDRLGPMMKRLGRDARTDYDWTPEQIATTHAEMLNRIPLEKISERQAWRDQRILALLKMKRDLKDPLN